MRWKLGIIGLGLVLVIGSAADAQLFCRNGQCRVGARVRRVVAAPVRALRVEIYSAPTTSAPVQAVPVETYVPVQEVEPVASSCAPVQMVQPASSCAPAIQSTGIFRRGLFPWFRSRRAARLSSRSGAYMQTTMAVPTYESSTVHIEPQAITIEDTGQAPGLPAITDDPATYTFDEPAPPPPLPSLSPVAKREELVAKQEPVPNFRVM